MADPTHPWSDRLSDYLDGELSDAERGALERHLAACPGCTATLADLTRVVMRARALAGEEPRRDLWGGIAARIGTKAAAGAPVRPIRAGRRPTFSWPQLAAAGLAIAVGSGGATWWATRANQTRPMSFSAPQAVESTPAVAVLTPRYDVAVADLQRVIRAGRSTLDTSTVRVLEQNLALIDRAIRDAERALAADPGNAYLNAHLARTMRQKIDLLRQAASLTAARS
jgi:anti-sigma factor RsiW